MYKLADNILVSERVERECQRHSQDILALPEKIDRWRGNADPHLVADRFVLQSWLVEDSL